MLYYKVIISIMPQTVHDNCVFYNDCLIQKCHTLCFIVKDFLILVLIDPHEHLMYNNSPFTAFIYCAQAPRLWTTPMASLIVSPQHRPSWAACEPWTYWRTSGAFWSSWTLRRERACVVRSQTLLQTVWWSGCMVTWYIHHIQTWNSLCIL